MSYIRQKSYGQWILQGDIYLHGILRITSSTYLLKATTSGLVSQTPAGVTAGNVVKKIKIQIDGADMYLLAADDWVDAGSQSVSPSSSSSPSASSSSSASPSASPSLSVSPSASSSASPST
jgi:hypothetical protein